MQVKKRLNMRSISSARHIELTQTQVRATPFPIPFSIDPVLACRDETTVMFASGDPFWYGAGTTITKHLEAHEWICHPASSTFSLAASKLGWALETVNCVGLHAQNFEVIWPKLQDRARWIFLLRDGNAVLEFCAWLTEKGFPDSHVTIMEALGGANARVRKTTANMINFDDIQHPVALGIDMRGKGIQQTTGLDDDLFITDGQLTKKHVRALTLSALAPRHGELLWDIGAGSGTISIEWLLAAPNTRAVAVETRADRIENITANAQKFGVKNRLEICHGNALETLQNLPSPNAVFIGGGASADLIDKIWAQIPNGARLVASAVTLETECLYLEKSAQYGGSLLKVELSHAKPLGKLRAWERAYPLTIWSAEKGATS